MLESKLLLIIATNIEIIKQIIKKQITSENSIIKLKENILNIKGKSSSLTIHIFSIHIKDQSFYQNKYSNQIVHLFNIRIKDKKFLHRICSKHIVHLLNIHDSNLSIHIKDQIFSKDKLQEKINKIDTT